MKLAVVFAVVIFILALVGTTTISYYNYQTANEILINQVENHLKTAIQSRVDHLETFLNYIGKLTQQMSQSIVIEKFLTTDKTDKIYESVLNDALIRLNNTAQVNPEIYDISVLNEFGIIVASNTPEMVGLNKSNEDCFISGRERTCIHDVCLSIFFKKQPLITVSSPICSETEKFLGVIVIRLNLDVLNNLTTDRTGLGETGEIYIINKDKLLITPSRFMNFSILVQEADTENSRNCFSIEVDDHEQAISFVDYRGEDVIGVHEYIPKMQWCMLAKIDKSEVFAQQRKWFIQTTSFVSIVIIILFSFIGYSIGRFLDKNYCFQRQKGVLKNGKK